jgi:flagellar motor switch protein FliG
MTGPEKAAVLLLRLPPSEADGVLARLDRARGEHVRAHMQRLRQSPPPPELVEQLLDDLDQILRGQAQTAPGATGSAPANDSSGAAAPESPAEPSDRLPDESSIEADPLAALRAMTGAGPERTPRNEERLSLALSDEHPRTVALVLSQMEPDPAGMVLKRLSPEMRRAVSLQLGKDINVNLDLVGRIVRTVLAKCRTLAETPAPAASTNRFKRMAEMLRRLDKPDRMEILVALEQNDAEAVAGPHPGAPPARRPGARAPRGPPAPPALAAPSVAPPPDPPPEPAGCRRVRAPAGPMGRRASHGVDLPGTGWRLREASD